MFGDFVEMDFFISETDVYGKSSLLVENIPPNTHGSNLGDPPEGFSLGLLPSSGHSSKCRPSCREEKGLQLLGQPRGWWIVLQILKVRGTWDISSLTLLTLILQHHHCVSITKSLEIPDTKLNSGISWLFDLAPLSKATEISHKNFYVFTIILDLISTTQRVFCK